MSVDRSGGNKGDPAERKSKSHVEETGKYFFIIRFITYISNKFFRFIRLCKYPGKAGGIPAGKGAADHIIEGCHSYIERYIKCWYWIFQ